MFVERCCEGKELIFCLQGAAGTFEHRLFMTQQGHVASYWHDIPLDNGDGTVNFVCEIPKETKAKMEVATVNPSHTSLQGSPS